MKREILAITDRGAWLRWRSRDLTASRIAALFDCHPFLTRAELAQDLRAGTECRRETASMRGGRRRERDVAIAVARARPHWHILPASSYHRLEPLRLGCTPDYWLGADGIVEIKTTRRWSGAPPAHYRLQLATQMLVVGLERGALAVSTRGALHLFEMEADGELEWAICDAAEAWWRAFDAGALPLAARLPALRPLVAAHPMPCATRPAAQPARVSPFQAMQIRAALAQVRQQHHRIL